ncbi:MAG: glycosyltransferase [Bacteroidales bacterium]|nr:glycosyltransferase [Bacteroidales bacterium]
MNITQIFKDNPDYIVIVVFGLSLLVQLVFYLGIYARFVFYRQKTIKKKQEPVSVIICARNEADNLDRYLPSVLSQDYPVYEVIVVNDCSNDHTDEVLGKYLKKYNHLRTTNISEDKKFSHGKKLAVTVGIKAAKHEILVFIDADCQPESDLWLARIQQHFTKEKSIVLGYGGYFRKNNLLNNYTRYETMTIAWQYFSYAMAGNPYMGVGRNLAYRKSLFFANKGFASHYHILSGDDDLFVNETANSHNTAVEFSRESHTRSEAKRILKEWLKQKRRHLTTCKYYKARHKFLLCIEPVSRFFYYGSFICLLSAGVFPRFIIPAFGLRFIIQLIFTKRAMMLLNEKNLLISSLFFDVLSLFINFMLHFSNRLRFKRRRQWK